MLWCRIRAAPVRQEDHRAVLTVKKSCLQTATDLACSLAAPLLIAVSLALPGLTLADAEPSELADLGRALFFDTRLSAGGNQSCSSCHDPSQAFSESRDNGTGGAVSLGDDGASLGDRNAPSLAYAFLIPEFHRNENGDYVGGFFIDGRAGTMIKQAQEPILNPIEMALPDADAVRERVREIPGYAAAFEKLLGPTSLDSATSALVSVATAIAEFESTAEFAPFDSKYDRYLRGEVELSDEEELGRILFFSELINCSRCHLLDRREHRPAEVFTSFRYHNIGVPINAEVRGRNGLGENHLDTGLLQHPHVNDTTQSGRFRVPSLRNVAVTGPYMHNGVFQELETAIVFYNRFLIATDESRINPETNQPWGSAEVPQTVDLELLREGQPLTNGVVSQLVAFLETLTDQRYEHLLDR
jgi:cytochrome c peroxidase